MVPTPPPAADQERGSGRPGVPSPADRTLDLLGRARAGDRIALDALCRRYLPRLERWARGRLPPSARDLFDTGDIVQEALIRVVRHIDEFAPEHEGAFQAYVRKTLFNLIRDAARRRSPISEREGDCTDPAPSPVDITIGHELADHYEAALDRLRPEDHQAVVLRIDFGCSYSEIADAMHKPSVDAARMAVSRALLRLAQEMRDDL